MTRLRRYAQLGYWHGRGEAEWRDAGRPADHPACRDNLCHTGHMCSACELPFDWEADTLCDCGCRAEYIAARRAGLGMDDPWTVAAYSPGYVTIGGDFVPRYDHESRDAFDARGALAAARYLRDKYDKGVRVLLSYQTREEAR